MSSCSSVAVFCPHKDFSLLYSRGQLERREEKMEKGKWRRTGGRGGGNRDQGRAPSFATSVLRDH